MSASRSKADSVSKPRDVAEVPKADIRALLLRRRAILREHTSRPAADARRFLAMMQSGAPFAATQYLKVMARQTIWTQN
jgi:hypothetical protein